VLGIGRATRIYLAPGATDMRKGMKDCTDWYAIDYSANRSAAMYFCSPMRDGIG